MEKTMSIRDRAILANKRLTEQSDELFRIRTKMKFEEIFGDVEYDISTDSNNLIIKSEGLVFYSDINEDGDIIFGVFMKCPSCNEIYTESFDSLAGLGHRLESQISCDCGHELTTIPFDNVMKELKEYRKVREGYIVRGDNNVASYE